MEFTCVTFAYVLTQCSMFTYSNWAMWLIRPLRIAYAGVNCRAGYLRAFSRSQVIINFHDVLVNYMVVRFSLLNGSGCVEKHGAPSVACFIHKRNSQTHIIRTYLVSYSPTLTHSLTHWTTFRRRPFHFLLPLSLSVHRHLLQLNVSK